MQRPIEELEELFHRHNKVNMLAMEAGMFEKYFAKIHAAVNLFRARPRSSNESEQLVGIACQLLEVALEHHLEKSLVATQTTVTIFDELVKQLTGIMCSDLKVTEASYQEAKKTKLKLDALKACGITPFGYRENHYSGRFGKDDKAESEKSEARRYAQENLDEFTRFVYELGQSRESIPDPFWGGPESSALSLYERVRSLVPGPAMMIQCADRSNKT